MKKFWNLHATLWLRIVLLLCGLLADTAVLNHYRNIGSDFVQDYVAAKSLLKGGSLYGKDIAKLENEILGFGGIQNFHPPFNALLFLPLSFLTYETAYIILGIFSIILLLMINLCIVKGLELKSEWFLNLTCFTLCWYPVIACLGAGQSSMIIAACLIGGWFCLRSEKVYIAGFLFAIATLIKLFPGLVLLYLFMQKKWKSFFATILFIALGLLITSFIVGIDNIRTYTTIMIAKDIIEWKGFVLNHSIGGIVTRVFGEHTPWTEPLVQLPYIISSILIVFLKVSVLFITIFAMSKMTDNQEVADYAFGLTTIAMLLFSPITWTHVFPVLILPIGLLLREYIDEPSSKKLRLLLIILFFMILPDVLIARALMAIHHPYRMPWYSMLLTLGPGVGLLILWIVFCRRVHKGAHPIRNLQRTTGVSPWVSTFN